MKMLLWQCGTVAMWYWGTVEMLQCGTEALWQCGTVTLLNCVNVAIWHCGTVALRHCGTLELWQCGNMALRHWGTEALRHWGTLLKCHSSHSPFISPPSPPKCNLDDFLSAYKSLCTPPPGWIHHLFPELGLTWHSLTSFVSKLFLE